MKLFVWTVRSCVTARLAIGSVDKRWGHAPLLSLDLSQSIMRLSWMLELNPIISTYLTMIIIVPLTSIMATIIMVMLVELAAMIIMVIVTTGAKGEIWYFGFDFGFIVGSHRLFKVDTCFMSSYLTGFWYVKGHES